MDAHRYRWIALIVIFNTIILSLLLSVVIPINQSRSSVNPYSSEERTEIGSLASTDTPNPTPSATPQTPLPIEAEAATQTATATPQANCTHTALFWVYHLDSWPEQFLLGNLTYTKEEALRYIQETPANISSLLYLHLDATYLNMINGADATAIEDTITDASEWLEKHPFGGTISGLEGEQAYVMARILEDFNQGIMGPGRCPDESSPDAFQGTGISVPVLSMTPSDILLTGVATPTPLASVTPTRTPRVPTYIPVSATATERPSRPSNPRPTRPAATQAPPPTSAPPPPTDEPPPPQPTREPPPTEPPPAGGF